MKASNLNYDVLETCDICDCERNGTMHHATGASGTIAPVLWTCHYCASPPAVIAAYRRAKWLVTFYGRKLHYIATTTRTERAARGAQFAAAKARINARRAATGRPLIGASS